MQHDCIHCISRNSLQKHPVINVCMSTPLHAEGLGLMRCLPEMPQIEMQLGTPAVHCAVCNSILSWGMPHNHCNTNPDQGQRGVCTLLDGPVAVVCPMQPESTGVPVCCRLNTCGQTCAALSWQDQVGAQTSHDRGELGRVSAWPHANTHMSDSIRCQHPTPIDICLAGLRCLCHRLACHLDMSTGLAADQELVQSLRKTVKILPGEVGMTL